MFLPSVYEKAGIVNTRICHPANVNTFSKKLLLSNRDNEYDIVYLFAFWTKKFVYLIYYKFRANELRTRIEVYLEMASIVPSWINAFAQC